MPSDRMILFLCTGNYYRSRFAELLFNHHAGRMGLGYRADSRGLATELGTRNVGPLSCHAADALRARGVAVPEPCRLPRQLAAEELEQAELVIALKEAEHRPFLARRFPSWPDRVRYWHVHDLDQATPDQALGEIEQHIVALMAEFRARGLPRC